MFLQILSILIPVLFAITLHEVGHGWAAKQLLLYVSLFFLFPVQPVTDR